MKTMLLLGLAVVMFCGAVSQASPLGVVFDDDFPGSSLDSGVWTSWGAGSLTVADSWVTLNPEWSKDIGMVSTASVHPDDGQTVVLSTTNMNVPVVDWGQGRRWRLNDDSGNEIRMYIKDLGQAGYNDVWVAIKKDGFEKTLKILDGGNWSGAFAVSWSLSQVVITRGSVVIFDTSDPAYVPSEGGSWDIPTTDLYAGAYAYSGNGTIGFDQMRLEVLPEPATVGLLAIGGLMTLIRRKRRDI